MMHVRVMLAGAQAAMLRGFQVCLRAHHAGHSKAATLEFSCVMLTGKQAATRCNFQARAYAIMHCCGVQWQTGSHSVRSPSICMVRALLRRLLAGAQAVTLSLGQEVGEPGAIIGAELLLATLECCGVDNARCVWQLCGPGARPRSPCPWPQCFD